MQAARELDPDYFSPVLLSSTFIARGYLGFLNEALGAHEEPTVEMRLTTDNPRNPLNRANARELALLLAMRRGELSEYRAVETNGRERSYFYAIASEPLQPACLRCHGDPADAPKMLLQQYGAEAGFHEQAGNIRALLSMRVSLEGYFREAQRFLLIIAAALLTVFAALYAIFCNFLHRIENSHRQINEQKAALERLSQRDPMTGALNRHGFRIAFENQLRVAQRYREPLGLILLDLDRFKQINDAHGHGAGDRVLVAVAAAVKHALRDSDLFCRWGGEEFLIAVPKNDPTRTAALAERLRVALAATAVDYAGQHVTVSASFGVAGLRDGDGLEQMVRRADDAMYRAKSGGRNRVVVDTPENRHDA